MEASRQGELGLRLDLKSEILRGCSQRNIPQGSWVPATRLWAAVMTAAARSVLERHLLPAHNVIYYSLAGQFQGGLGATQWGCSFTRWKEVRIVGSWASWATLLQLWQEWEIDLWSDGLLGCGAVCYSSSLSLSNTEVEDLKWELSWVSVTGALVHSDSVETDSGTFEILQSVPWNGKILGKTVTWDDLKGTEAVALREAIGR